MSLESFARQSLAQFMTIYAEIVEGTENIPAAELEREMWARIKGSAPSASSNKIPYHLLKKVKIQLPYLPDYINYMGCAALKKADGLYVPCCAPKTEGLFCQSCNKSGAKFGVLEDRGAVGTYTDPSDKHEITYGTWLAKHEKTIEEVHQMLHNEGFTLTIPEGYLMVNAKRVTAKRRAGRPSSAKAKVNSDSDDSSDEEEPIGLVTLKGEPTTFEENKPKGIIAEFDSDEEEEVKVAEKPKKAEKPKPKTKKSDDEAEKKEKPKPKTKKSDDEAEPKKATKTKKSDDESEPKKEKPKPKTKKSDDESEPKKEKPKPKTKKSDDEAEPKEKKEKPKAKAEKPTPKKEEVKTEEGEVEEEEYEPEDEDIIYNGESYILRDNSVVFNQEGEIVGNWHDGKMTFV